MKRTPQEWSELFRAHAQGDFYDAPDDEHLARFAEVVRAEALGQAAELVRVFSADRYEWCSSESDALAIARRLICQMRDEVK